MVVVVAAAAILLLVVLIDILYTISFQYKQQQQQQQLHKKNLHVYLFMEHWILIDGFNKFQSIWWLYTMLQLTSQFIRILI